MACSFSDLPQLVVISQLWQRVKFTDFHLMGAGKLPLMLSYDAREDFGQTLISSGLRFFRLSILEFFSNKD